MRRFRIPLVIIGVLILLGLIGGGAAFHFTRGAVEAADKFFAAMAESGAATAYTQAAPAFREATAQDDFANVAERLKLTSFRSASWSNRSVIGATAKLEGTLTLAQGGPLPITVDLVEDESGTWRVLSFKTAPAGVQSSVDRPTMPDEAKQHQLAQVSVVQLIEAIHAKNFQALQASGATVFRQQLTVQAPAKVAASIRLPQYTISRVVAQGSRRISFTPAAAASGAERPVDGLGRWLSLRTGFAANRPAARANPPGGGPAIRNPGGRRRPPA